MNSLEWRVKKLENKILGQTTGIAQIDRIISQASNQESIYDQLDSVAKQYNSFINSTGKNYPKFIELYNKYRNFFSELENTNDVNESTKAELVLAYEDDLINYMHDTKSMAEKADRVLSVDNWPDLTVFQKRLDKLEKIKKDQHIHSVTLDKRTEELIEIYNDIIGSFKGNIAIWNQRLEAYENADKKSEDD